MINYEEELKKFHPSLVTDILKELINDEKKKRQKS